MPIPLTCLASDGDATAAVKCTVELSLRMGGAKISNPPSGARPWAEWTASVEGSIVITPLSPSTITRCPSCKRSCNGPAPRIAGIPAADVRIEPWLSRLPSSAMMPVKPWSSASVKSLSVNSRTTKIPPWRPSSFLRSLAGLAYRTKRKATSRISANLLRSFSDSTTSNKRSYTSTTSRSACSK